MNRHRLVLHTAAFSIAFLMFSATAWADLTGTVYNVAGNLNNATFVPAQNVNGTVATIDVPDLEDLNFVATGVQTLGHFLTAPGVTVTNGALSAYLSDLASGTVADGGKDGAGCYSGAGGSGSATNNSACYSTEIELTGTVFLTANATYTFSHDDGVVLSVGAGSATNLLPNGSQDPTTDVDSSFTWGGASGSYTVNIGYMATNGNPEDLVESETGVPEPGAVSMLVAMLVGVAGLTGILKKKLA